MNPDEIAADPLDGVKLAAILRPGDRVLLTVDDGFEMNHLDEMKAFLGERFPGVEFTLAIGVDHVLVQPGPNPTTDSPKEQP